MVALRLLTPLVLVVLVILVLSELLLLLLLELVLVSGLIPVLELQFVLLLAWELLPPAKWRERTQVAECQRSTAAAAAAEQQ